MLNIFLKFCTHCNANNGRATGESPEPVPAAGERFFKPFLGAAEPFSKHGSGSCMGGFGAVFESREPFFLGAPSRDYIKREGLQF